MEKGQTRTLLLADARGNGRHLRITWHPASRVLVFSHWNGAICTASTPVNLEDAASIPELIVDALRSSLTSRASDGGWRARRATAGFGFVRRARPVKGSVVPLPRRAHRDGPATAGGRGEQP